MPRLKRRRRRAEHDPGPLYLAAQHGSVAGVVARIVVLLVAWVVFLIYDDEPEIANRGENRATGPHDDTGVARADSVPFVVAFTFR